MDLIATLRYLGSAAATGVIIYLIVVTVFTIQQRKLVYRPGTWESTPADFALDDVQVISLRTDDGELIPAWYHPPKEGEDTVILFHGNAGSIIGRWVGELMDGGFGVLAATYRGFPGATGSPSENGLYSDARAAVRFVLDRPGTDAERVLVMGYSLGSAVAVQMATEWDFAKLLLIAPFTSMVDVASYHYPLLPVGPLLSDRFTSKEKMAHVNAPVLVFHGTDDLTVPIKFGRQLFESAKNKDGFVEFEGIGHNDIDFSKIVRVLRKD